MFKNLWKDDYIKVCKTNKIYKRYKKGVRWLIVLLVLFVNVCLLSTPVNAYNAGASDFNFENFSDYKDVETCNYSLSATKSSGMNNNSGLSMSCVTIDNLSKTANDYEYVKTSEKIYDTSYYTWTKDEELKTGKISTYYDNVLGSNALVPTEYITNNGDAITIYNASTTDYLMPNGQKWDYYSILQYTPSWISDSRYIFNRTSNGEIYYNINGNSEDSYYRYDKDGNIVYNQFAEFGSADLEYLYTNENNYMYDIPVVDGYTNDYVTISNVNQANYKLQKYEQSYTLTDVNGKIYGDENFENKSYFKDGLFYLWDSFENKFYSYEINTLQELGFIDSSLIEQYFNDGKTIITKSLENQLISKIKMYREYYETTYEISSNEKLIDTTTLETSIPSTSTNNTYTYHDISNEPVSVDSTYKYLWTYVSDYLYEYESEFAEQNYQYAVVDEISTDIRTDLATYGLKSNGSDTTTNGANINKSGNTLCSVLTKLTGSSIKCYEQSNTNRFSWSFNFNISIFSKTTSDSFYINKSISDSKLVYIGGVPTTIYKDSTSIGEDNGWYYIENNAKHFIEKNVENVFAVSTITGTTEKTYDGNQHIISNSPNNTEIDLFDENSGTYYTNRNVYENKVMETRYNNKYKNVYTYSYSYYYDAPSHAVLSVAQGLSSYNDYFYVLDSTSSSFFRYDIKGYNRPNFYYIKMYNDEEGYQYYAAPAASITQTKLNITTKSKGKYNNCSGPCINDMEGMDYKIWYKISASEYNSNSFDIANKTQKKLENHGPTRFVFVHKYNVITEYKFSTNTYYDSIGKTFTGINTQTGTSTLYHGYVYKTGLYSVPSASATDYSAFQEHETNSLGDNSYSNYYYVNEKIPEKRYLYCVIEKGILENEETPKSGTTSGSGLNTKYFYETVTNNEYFDPEWENDKNNGHWDVQYSFDFVKYNITLEKTNTTSTGNYKFINNEQNYFYSGTSPLIYSTSSTSKNKTDYSKCSGENAGIYNGCKITKSSIVYNQIENLPIYKDIITSSKTITNTYDSTDNQGINITTAIERIKNDAQFIDTIYSVSQKPNNQIELTLADGSKRIVDKTEYIYYTYYISSLKEGTMSSNNEIGDYYENGFVSFQEYENKKYGNLTYTNISNSVQDNVTFFNNGEGLHLETTITNVKTTTHLRTKNSFVGFVANGTKMKLYNANANSDLSSNTDFGYEGTVNDYLGLDKTLVSCNSSTTEKCYIFVNNSTVNKRQLEENTSLVSTNNITYSQNKAIDKSLDSTNNAFYKNHIPTDEESNNAGYQRRICSNATDVKCYKNDVVTNVNFKNRYALITHIITYSVIPINHPTPILYGESTINSYTNDYLEFGMLLNASYDNNGNYFGGTYSKEKTQGLISSKNMFNELHWFNNLTTELIKKYENNEFVFEGNGIMTQTVSGFEVGKTYTISFDAKSIDNGNIKIIIDGNEMTTFTLNNEYYRYDLNFVAESGNLNISFNISNGLEIKDIMIAEGTNTVYSKYATYELGNVTDTFFQTFDIVEAFAYYDITSENNTSIFDLFVSTNVIGYNKNIGEDNYTEELIKQNEIQRINYNYVAYGLDFNKNNAIDENEMYYGYDNALYSVCLDDSVYGCEYRYIKTSKSNDLSYIRNRNIIINFSEVVEYLNKDEMTSINNVDTSLLEGELEVVDSNDALEDSANYVKINGKFYSVNTTYGKYALLLEYINKTGYNANNFKFNIESNSFYYLINNEAYSKYLVSHDDNKLYNSVTKVYDKLDKGYTEEQKYTTREELQTLVDYLTANDYSYLNENSVVIYADSETELKYSQKKLYDLLEKGETSISYDCEDESLGISVNNCTFKYISNNYIEPILIEDLLVGAVEETGYYGLLISNMDFKNQEEYFEYENTNYKIQLNDDVNGFTEYEKYLFGGYWKEEEVMPLTDFTYVSGNNYANYSVLYKQKGTNLELFKLKNDDTVYTSNTSFYILKNSNGNEIIGDYSNNKNEMYFYAWISGNIKDSDYSGFEVVKKMEISDVYRSALAVLNSEDTTMASRYIEFYDDSIKNRVAIKDLLVTKNAGVNIFKLKVKSSDNLNVTNIIDLADLQELDLSKSIDSKKLAGANNIYNDSVSYALKFSGMMNYWNGLINGSDIVSLEENQETGEVNCTLTALNIKQKNSTITFNDETVSEFILQNKGASNLVNGQNVYDLYALTQVVENGKYYYVAGKGENNIINQLVEVLNILYKNGYTGYMFSKKSKNNQEVISAISELEELSKNSLINWSELADKPELIEKWFGNSSYANLMFYDYEHYADKTNNKSNGVSLYNAQTAFTSDHTTVYEQLYKNLFSYYMFGMLYSQYGVGDGNGSTPYLDDLLFDTITKNSLETGKEKDKSFSDHFKAFVNSFIDIYLSNGKNDDKLNSFKNEIESDFTSDNIKYESLYSNFYVELSQSVATLLDSYMVINKYEVGNRHGFSKAGVYSVNEKVLSMLPTLYLGADIDDTLNMLTAVKNSDSSEFNITSLFDYVSKSKTTDYVFVKSEKHEERYYIYKLLESTDKTANTEGSAPSSTVIRQNTSTNINNISLYNNYNSLNILNKETRRYETFNKTLYEYGKKQIDIKGADAFKKWWGTLFSGKGFECGDYNKENVLYAMITGGTIESLLDMTTITNLSNYIYTTDSLNSNYKVVHSYDSYTSVNPSYYYNWVSLTEDDFKELTYEFAWQKYNHLDSLGYPDVVKRPKESYSTKEEFIEGYLNGEHAYYLEDYVVHLNPNDLIYYTMGNGFKNSFEEYVNNKYSELPGQNANHLERERNESFYVNVLTKDGKTFKERINTNSIKVLKHGETSNGIINFTCQKEYCLSTSLKFKGSVNENNPFDISFKWETFKQQGTYVYNYYLSYFTFNINTDLTAQEFEELNQQKTHINGHYNGNVFGNFTESSIENINTGNGLIINNISKDNNYNIGQTDFNIEIDNENTKIYSYANNNNNYEYSLSYVLAEGKCGEDFYYNVTNNTCYYDSSIEKSGLFIKDINYKHIIDYSFSYNGVNIYSDMSVIAFDELIKETIVLNTSKEQLTQTEIDNFVKIHLLPVAGVSTQNGVYQNVINSVTLNYATEKSQSLSDMIKYDYYNTGTGLINISNLPQNCDYTFKIRKRFYSGYTSSPYVTTFSTKDDIVLNPYGITLKDIDELELTNKQLVDGLINGDTLLKSETIPYNLQKCLFTYDSTPTNIGTSICNNYVISNKYRLQTTEPVTIAVGFTIVDINTNKSILTNFTGNTLYFVEDINTSGSKRNYHIVNNSRNVAISNDDAGVFYFEFTNEDFKEYQKYDTLEQFVCNYIMKKYTIEISESLYNLIIKNFENGTYKIKATAFYDSRYTYLDYNQNGIYDEESLDISSTYFTKEGVQTYYESSGKKEYTQKKLAYSISEINNWITSGFTLDNTFYNEFKTGAYKYDNQTYYYIFAYDRNSSGHIVK